MEKKKNLYRIRRTASADRAMVFDNGGQRRQDYKIAQKMPTTDRAGPVLGATVDQ